MARLARLDLTEEQLDHYGEQLKDIVAYAAQVQAVDTGGVEEMGHPMGMTNAFRDDVVADTLDRDRVLDGAPATKDGYFVVPPSLGVEESDSS